jgi:hypothetical protein
MTHGGCSQPLGPYLVVKRADWVSGPHRSYRRYETKSILIQHPVKHVLRPRKVSLRCDAVCLSIRCSMRPDSGVRGVSKSEEPFTPWWQACVHFRVATLEALISCRGNVRVYIEVNLKFVSTPALRLAQPPPFPGSKAWPGRDADHSPHLLPRSRMSRSYISFPPLAPACCIRDKFTFLLLVWFI